MCGCVSKRPRPYNTSSPLVLLQISPDDEHAVPLRSRRQFLQAADTRELLRTPAFRKHDVDLETVADLFVACGWDEHDTYRARSVYGPRCGAQSHS